MKNKVWSLAALFTREIESEHKIDRQIIANCMILLSQNDDSIFLSEWDRLLMDIKIKEGLEVVTGWLAEKKITNTHPAYVYILKSFLYEFLKTAERNMFDKPAILTKDWLEQNRIGLLVEHHSVTEEMKFLDYELRRKKDHCSMYRKAALLGNGVLALVWGVFCWDDVDKICPYKNIEPFSAFSQYLIMSGILLLAYEVFNEYTPKKCAFFANNQPINFFEKPSDLDKELSVTSVRP